MVPIGNDIVDRLEWLLNPPHHRFASRVLCAEELIAFESHRDSQTYLQTVWAAKESVYKLMRQQGASLSFRPNQLRYIEDQGIVLAGSTLIKVNHTICPEFIYAYAFANAAIGAGIQLISNVAKVRCMDSTSGMPSGEASRAVRDLARKMILGGNSTEEVTVQFVKGPDGAPLAEVNGIRLPIGLSFTHDGLYVAVAMSYRSERQMFTTINMDHRSIDPRSLVATHQGDNFSNILRSGEA
jgi:phosphopantetheinyl transferase (holo-ACP synthase)